MRRSVVFAVLTLPAAVWASVTLWAQAQASGWTPAAGEVSLPVRAALASNHWIIRLLPFAIILGVLTWPVIVWGIAVITGASSSRNTARHADVVAWWSVSGIVFVATAVTSAILFFYEPTVEVPTVLLACLAWSGIVAFWLSLAAAYAVQQKRYVSHESPWHPRSLLIGVGAVNCVGLFALPLLAVIAFRRGGRSGAEAVEQADAADEAQGGTRTAS